MKRENATPEFVALNPDGVVPVLVHDGRTLTESNDIIQYLDSGFDGPRLSADNDADAEYLRRSLRASTEFQGAFKLLVHEFLFKPVRRMNERELSQYAREAANEELVNFMREFSSKEGFSEERIVSAISAVEQVLSRLNARLTVNHWLSGSHFGLTDISWFVNLHRLTHMRYPLAEYPRVSAWLERFRCRNSYRSAVTAYEPGKAIAFFKVYTWFRQLRGTSVGDLLDRNRDAVNSMAASE